MLAGAASFTVRSWRYWALASVFLWPSLAAHAAGISVATYEDPTTRYGHAVLGDDVEHGTLVLTLDTGEVLRFELPKTSVFEDTAPRLVDLDNDGQAEVIVVESDQSRGARLVVYGVDGVIAATPYIGTRFRWLAPLGAADLDGDGLVEIAYVDRPHLAKILRIWRFDKGNLTEVATAGGVTNHRIGETDIAGGIRSCGEVPEMVLASANWGQLLAVGFQDGRIEARQIGQDTSRAAFARAMDCAD